MRLRVILLALAASASLAAQQPESQMPRFRAGANLVRVDAYVSKDQVALTDLAADDFRVFEDDVQQKVEAFELVRARGPVPENERSHPTNTRDMRQQVLDAARVFTLFFDPVYVSLAGSYKLQEPLVDALNKMIGPDDMVGAMTPDMAPSSITYSRRTEDIERMVTRHWTWGRRDRQQFTDQESMIANCYDPDEPRERGIAREMIARLREERTLNALASLVTHLEGLRPERKFVVIFTEGWMLFRPNASLSRVLEGPGPTPEPLTTDPATGRIRPQGSPTDGGLMTRNACERLRLQLAQADHERDFLTLLQRANRANVSFYPVDARGLVVFDQPTNFDLPPTVDQDILRRRWDYLRDMAAQTDGVAILDVGNLTAGLSRMFADVGSYYLLSYYSTNQKLDGRFRRIRVEVSRPGVDVRARRGYLAPTEAEARGATMATASSSGPPAAVTRALEALAPARGDLPARIQAAGAPGIVRAIVELDAATMKRPEWASGGSLRLTIVPAKGGEPSMVNASIASGQRAIPVEAVDAGMVGSYQVRAELVPRSGGVPLQVNTTVEIPGRDALAGSAGMAFRRGPSTGLAYIPTADPRFRRTERLRVEVMISSGVTGVGRVLTREGQPLPIVVSYTTRADAAADSTYGVADVGLSSLATGEYVLEVSLAKDGKTEIVTYGFRLVP